MKNYQIFVALILLLLFACGKGKKGVEVKKNEVAEQSAEKQVGEMHSQPIREEVRSIDEEAKEGVFCVDPAIHDLSFVFKYSGRINKSSRYAVKEGKQIEVFRRKNGESPDYSKLGDSKSFYVCYSDGFGILLIATFNSQMFHEKKADFGLEEGEYQKIIDETGYDLLFMDAYYLKDCVAEKEVPQEIVSVSDSGFLAPYFPKYTQFYPVYVLRAIKEKGRAIIDQLYKEAGQDLKSTEVFKYYECDVPNAWCNIPLATRGSVEILATDENGKVSPCLLEADSVIYCVSMYDNGFFKTIIYNKRDFELIFDSNYDRSIKTVLEYKYGLISEDQLMNFKVLDEYSEFYEGSAIGILNDYWLYSNRLPVILPSEHYEKLIKMFRKNHFMHSAWASNNSREAFSNENLRGEYVKTLIHTATIQEYFSELQYFLSNGLLEVKNEAYRDLIGMVRMRMPLFRASEEN